MHPRTWLPCLIAVLTSAALIADDEAAPPPAPEIASVPVLKMKPKETITIMMTNDSNEPWVYEAGNNGPVHVEYYLRDQEGRFLGHQVFFWIAHGEIKGETVPPGESRAWTFTPSLYYPDLQSGWYQVWLKYEGRTNPRYDFVTTPMKFDRRVAWMHFPGAGAGPGPAAGPKVER